MYQAQRPPLLSLLPRLWVRPPFSCRQPTMCIQILCCHIWHASWPRIIRCTNVFRRQLPIVVQPGCCWPWLVFIVATNTFCNGTETLRQSIPDKRGGAEKGIPGTRVPSTCKLLCIRTGSPRGFNVFLSYFRCVLNWLEDLISVAAAVATEAEQMSGVEHLFLFLFFSDMVKPLH